MNEKENCVLNDITTLLVEGKELNFSLGRGDGCLHKGFREFKDKFESVLKNIIDTNKKNPSIFNLSEKLLININASFQDVTDFFEKDLKRCAETLEFEFIPLLRILYLVQYYFFKVNKEPQKKDKFESEEYAKLVLNHYVSHADKKQNYKYDVSFFILAYNNLEVTKQCIKSFFKTVEPSLNYELILINNGSTDGTKEYFETIPCSKRINLRENDLMFSFLVHYLVEEGKYTCGISNDVIFCKNSIKNLITCIEADETHRYVVPMTTNMFNNQEPDLPKDITEIEDIIAWGNENNKESNPYLWEQRVILYNPVTIFRSTDMFGEEPLLLLPFKFRFTGTEGNDTVMSTLTRRSGNKCILAKDAFCYHHDHITRKAEKHYDSKEHHDKKSEAIQQAIKIPHEVTGRCYSRTLMNQLDLSKTGRIEILGFNCGLGGNTLKIKELYKEHKHHLDCVITHYLDSHDFDLDLPTFCKEFHVVSDLEEIRKSIKTYDYIIFEDPFTFQHQQQELLELLFSVLKEGGTLLLGQPTQEAKEFFKNHSIVEYGNHGTMLECLVYHKKEVQ